MSEHCPQDGGFIGDAGCTHPNHQHSELAKGMRNIEFVFNVIPKRELKKRFAGTAANGNPSTAANYTKTSSGKARG